MSTNVVVVTNIPRPYRRALFQVLEKQLQTEGLTLRVLYTSDPSKHARRGSQSTPLYDLEVEAHVSNHSIRFGYERVIALPVGLPQMLKRLDPCCVVTGGFGLDSMLSAGFCSTFRLPRIVWSGSLPGHESEVGFASLVVRKHLLKGAKAVIAYGTAAGEYFASLGVGSDRIFHAWNTVDLEGVAAAARAAAAQRPALTPKYRLAERNLLYVGTLLERKGVPELVAATMEAESHGTDWALHLAGAGPLRPQLEQQVSAAGLEARVRFHGHLPPEGVFELLGVADGFFLPTKQEAWGLVINEAMACGVPVVVSPWAGATRDLVTDGETGYVVEPSDHRRLVEIMSKLAAGDPGCAEVGRAGYVAVRSKASLDKSAEGFVAAVKCALKAGRRG